MMEKGLGQYDTEYAACECFWGTEPGKFVRQLPNLVPPGKVLDLGCGEGKNAIYLAQHGFSIVAIDCSALGLRNFRKRLQSVTQEISDRIVIHQQDVRSFTPNNDFDVVIAYGLLHCLSNLNDVRNVAAKMRGCTRLAGLNVAVAFTNEMGVPTAQSYLEPTLLPCGFLESQYSDWRILASENSVIEEVHPTSKVFHQHSVCRIIAQRNSQ
jgi:tellurite methyltransferase